MLHRHSPIIFRQFLMKLIYSSMKKFCLDFGIHMDILFSTDQRDPWVAVWFYYSSSAVVF